MLKTLAFFIIKILGIKKIFSQTPVDYIKLRKSDKNNPPKSFFRKFTISSEEVLQTKIWTIKNAKDKNHSDLVIFIHGGAFISGPAEHHWTSIEKIKKNTNNELWLIVYPKAPESNIKQITNNIDAVYELALKKYPPEKIVLIGDSVGANLIMTLTQRLIKKRLNIPSKLILITPVFDSSMCNPEIDFIAKKDPMLAKEGVLSAKRMCSDGLDLKDELLSPLYGDFISFPETMLFLGGKDIMYPDGKKGVAKMREAEVDLTVIDNPEMPHIFPLLPVMIESKKALNQIIESLKS